MADKRKKKNKPIGIRILQGAFCVLLIYGLFISTHLYFQKQEKMAQMKANEEKIREQTEDIKALKRELSKSDSLEYVEEVAREDLGMVKPREIIFIDKNNSKED